MKRRIGFMALAIALMTVLAGCASFKQDILSTADIAIVNAEGKTIVSYGMDRAQVEKTLGVGTEDSDMKWVMYEDIQASIWYRDNKVVGYIFADPDLASARGLKVGMPAAAIRKLYGSDTFTKVKNEISEGTATYFYCYDTRLQQPVYVSTTKPLPTESLKKYITVSILLDEDSNVKSISCVDGLMSFYLQ